MSNPSEFSRAVKREACSQPLYSDSVEVSPLCSAGLAIREFESTPAPKSRAEFQLYLGQLQIFWCFPIRPEFHAVCMAAEIALFVRLCDFAAANGLQATLPDPNRRPTLTSHALSTLAYQVGRECDVSTYISFLGAAGHLALTYERKMEKTQ